jgi:DNA helicase HerA-like ATPase
MLDYLTDQVSPDHNDPSWTAGVQLGTMSAFLRRLYALAPRLGQLIATGVTAIQLARSVTVVDLHSLHDDAQRFVVGALLSQIFAEKQGSGREPLRFVVLDELNKYAPRDGRSPIKEILIDIAARGRSLGVILIGAQQVSSNVERAIIDNAAIKVVGRLDAASADEYRFLSSELRERASRFLPGTMVLDQPLVPAPIPFRFPFPAYATCVSEDGTGEQRLGDPAVIEELLADL